MCHYGKVFSAFQSLAVSSGETKVQKKCWTLLKLLLLLDYCTALLFSTPKVHQQHIYFWSNVFCTCSNKTKEDLRVEEGCISKCAYFMCHVRMGKEAERGWENSFFIRVGKVYWLLKGLEAAWPVVCSELYGEVTGWGLWFVLEMFARERDREVGKDSGIFAGKFMWLWRQMN